MAAANGSDTGLMMPNSENDSRVWTTNMGHPVSDNISSLTIGRRGPAVIEDYHLLEKLAQFDRERIPERVVHARGMAAKGYFEVTKDITHLSCADLFSEVGKRTPLIARLSTVIHERGSPESLRDVRGFSVKFYTQEGNWDFVGNNIPVFFIRDAMNFVDLVHALKPDPRSHLQRGWRILDYLSHHPESCHTLTWLLDDNGIPKNWRNLDGFGVHTFKLVARDGKETLVKFHWQPKDGAKFLDDEEATQVGEANKRQSHATQDLYEAIEKGDYPEWKFLIQTMDPADQESLPFDPLDATKVWPEEQFPLQEVGRMVLDKNVDNWFNENEMLAFSPGVIVPGIAFSDDKLLQGRIFSYSDTQRYRLGANYALLPVNQPKCPYHNNHYDGLMNMTLRNEDVDYFPSRMNAMKEAAKGPTYSQAAVEGKREKSVIAKEENFMQAGQRIRSMDERRRNNFIKRLLQWMTEPQCTNEVRQIWLGYWSECDKAFGAELAAKLDEAMAKESEE